MKRLVVGVFVSAVAVVGIAPVASAAPRDTHIAVAKLKKPKAPKVIDWDAPSRSPMRPLAAEREGEARDEPLRSAWSSERDDPPGFVAERLPREPLTQRQPDERV
jgi:hypothetical protein